jgi:hypothetical protein
MAKIALTSNSWQNSFQGLSNRTRGEVLDDSDDDTDGEKWLISFWKGPQDWSSG